jgi:hypothetical protein
MASMVTLTVFLALVAAGLWALRNAARREQSRPAAVAAPVPAGVKCPTCSSGSVHRVTAGQRAMSGVAAGVLFSRRARAQFRCSNCGYFW